MRSKSITKKLQFQLSLCIRSPAAVEEVNLQPVQVPEGNDVVSNATNSPVAVEAVQLEMVPVTCTVSHYDGLDELIALEDVYAKVQWFLGEQCSLS